MNDYNNKSKPTKISRHWSKFWGWAVTLEWGDLVRSCGQTYYNMWVGLVQILWSTQSMLWGLNGWSVLLQPFLSLKSEFIVFVEAIKDSVTSSFKISKAVGVYNKFLQNSLLRFNVTVDNV